MRRAQYLLSKYWSSKNLVEIIRDVATILWTLNLDITTLAKVFWFARISLSRRIMVVRRWTGCEFESIMRRFTKSRIEIGGTEVESNRVTLFGLSVCGPREIMPVKIPFRFLRYNLYTIFVNSQIESLDSSCAWPIGIGCCEGGGGWGRQFVFWGLGRSGFPLESNSVLWTEFLLTSSSLERRSLVNFAFDSFGICDSDKLRN